MSYDIDPKFMEAAIGVAKNANGYVSGYKTGSVLVKDNKIIYCGWNVISYSEFEGILQVSDIMKHSERIAIESASGECIDTDLYTTHEPCSYRKLENGVPSCCDLILKSGIRRVFFGIPNPHNNGYGEGYKYLRSKIKKSEFPLKEVHYLRGYEDIIIEMGEEGKNQREVYSIIREGKDIKTLIRDGNIDKKSIRKIKKFYKNRHKRNQRF